ncbi:hypothetical protein YC2023_099817 [Brassica napus]
MEKKSLIYYLVQLARNKHRVEITNQLGHGILLQLRCKNSNRGDTGNKELTFNNTFIDIFPDPGPVTFMGRWEVHCDLWYDKYHNRFEAYRSAAFKRCGQRRLWTAKKDGIYFRRGYDKPSEFERHWNYVP